MLSMDHHHYLPRRQSSARPTESAGHQSRRRDPRGPPLPAVSHLNGADLAAASDRAADTARKPQHSQEGDYKPPSMHLQLNPRHSQVRGPYQEHARSHRHVHRKGRITRGLVGGSTSCPVDPGVARHRVATEKPGRCQWKEGRVLTRLSGVPGGPEGPGHPGGPQAEQACLLELCSSLPVASAERPARTTQRRMEVTKAARKDQLKRVVVVA
ncbi:unnamed protein product [Arctogadus glacialis]